MPGKRQPTDLVVANGRKHLSQSEEAERRAGEIRVEPPKTAKAPKWLPEGLRKDFRALGKRLIAAGLYTDLDADTLGRYLLAHHQWLIATQETETFAAGIPFLKRLGYASDVTVTGPDALGSDKEEAAKGVVTVVTHVARIGMPLAELVDLEKEKARIAKALKKNQGELDKLNNKLGNPGFLAKAPENVVKTEQERAEKLAALIAQLEQQAASL